MFGRATITLGIDPHFWFFIIHGVCGVLLRPAASCGFHADRVAQIVSRVSLFPPRVLAWKIDSHHHHHHHIQSQRRIQYICTTHQLLCYATTHTTTFLQMHNNTP